jgi:hypothetical protein
MDLILPPNAYLLLTTVYYLPIYLSTIYYLLFTIYFSARMASLARAARAMSSAQSSSPSRLEFRRRSY